jgi:hypothetical protein
MSWLSRNSWSFPLCFFLMMLCASSGAQNPINRSISALQGQAEAGNPDAQAKIGQMLLTGIGATKDPANGFKWSYRAALAGSPSGARMVGFAYNFGVGVKQNRKAAFEWVRIAALRGDAASQRIIVSFYLAGEYVDKDLTVAYAWALVREAAGDRRIANLSAFTGSSLLGDQKEEAVELATAWAKNKNHIMPFHSNWYFEHSAGSEPIRPHQPPTPKPTTSCSSGHWVSSNVDEGKYIVLEDGSLWAIDDADTVDSGLWLETDEITVCPGKLIDTDDNTSAGARRLK